MDSLIKNRNIIQIAGSITSGKGTLAALLEGHSHCFSLPFLHDKLASGLVDYTDNYFLIPWIGHSTSLLPLFRTLYSNTDLCMLRVYAYQKYVTFVASADKTLCIPIDINYGEFENNLFEDLEKEDLITPEIAVKTIFDNLQKCFNQMGTPARPHTHTHTHTHTIMSHNLQMAFKTMINFLSSIKMQKYYLFIEITWIGFILMFGEIHNVNMKI